MIKNFNIELPIPIIEFKISFVIKKYEELSEIDSLIILLIFFKNDIGAHKNFKDTLLEKYNLSEKWNNLINNHLKNLIKRKAIFVKNELDSETFLGDFSLNKKIENKIEENKFLNFKEESQKVNKIYFYNLLEVKKDNQFFSDFSKKIDDPNILSYNEKFLENQKEVILSSKIFLAQEYSKKSINEESETIDEIHILDEDISKFYFFKNNKINVFFKIEEESKIILISQENEKEDLVKKIRNLFLEEKCYSNLNDYITEHFNFQNTTFVKDFQIPKSENFNLEYLNFEKQNKITKNLKENFLPKYLNNSKNFFIEGSKIKEVFISELKLLLFKKTENSEEKYVLFKFLWDRELENINEKYIKEFQEIFLIEMEFTDFEKLILFLDEKISLMDNFSLDKNKKNFIELQLKNDYFFDKYFFLTFKKLFNSNIKLVMEPFFKKYVKKDLHKILENLEQNEKKLSFEDFSEIPEDNAQILESIIEFIDPNLSNLKNLDKLPKNFSNLKQLKKLKNIYEFLENKNIKEEKEELELEKLVKEIKNDPIIKKVSRIEENQEIKKRVRDNLIGKIVILRQELDKYVGITKENQDKSLLIKQKFKNNKKNLKIYKEIREFCNEFIHKESPDILKESNIDNLNKKYNEKIKKWKEIREQ